MSQKKSYIEVSVTSEDGSEYIYWVKLTDMPFDGDEIDWSIQRAISYHLTATDAPIAKHTDDFEPVTAYEPFSRNSDEYVVVETLSKKKSTKTKKAIFWEFNFPRYLT